MAHTYSFRNLKTPQNTTSGISDFVLVAPEADFIEGGIKCPEPPFNAPGDKIRITTAHEFDTDRAFAKLVCAPNTNELVGASIGDLGFKKLDLTVTVFVAGSYAEVHEAVAEYLNVPLIVLVKDSECSANLWYQLGCDCEKAYLDANFGTGKSKEGKKGYELKFNVASSAIRLYDVDGGPAILP